MSLQQPASVLLDKGVVRRVYEFQVRVARGLFPTSLQIEAVKVLARLQNQTPHLYITEETAHILQLRSPQYTRIIQSQTETLHSCPE